MSNRFKDLNNDQLQGANWALRLLHTSPRVTGKALALLKELIEESFEEMANPDRVKKTCSNCKGVGKVYEPFPTPTRGMEVVPCPDCTESKE